MSNLFKDLSKALSTNHTIYANQGNKQMSNSVKLTTLNENLDQLNTELNGLDQQLIEAETERDHFEYSCSDDEFNEHLDELYGEVEVCGYYYSASKALYELDPTAWRCAKNDYEAEYDLDQCEDYQEILETIENIELEITDKESEIEDVEQEISDLQD